MWSARESIEAQIDALRQLVERQQTHLARMEEQDVLDLLELQRLTRELLDHLTAIFPLEAAAELLREMADASGLYLQAVLFRGSRSTRPKEDSGGTTRIS